MTDTVPDQLPAMFGIGGVAAVGDSVHATSAAAVQIIMSRRKIPSLNAAHITTESYTYMHGPLSLGVLHDTIKPTRTRAARVPFDVTPRLALTAHDARAPTVPALSGDLEMGWGSTSTRAGDAVVSGARALGTSHLLRWRI